MNNAIPTPRQTYTIENTKEEIINALEYIANELPTYKLLDKNEKLNSLRIEITRGFQPQHLDVRFQETDSDKTTFEIEVSKHTGGMTNDDSNLYAKKNLDECMGYLIKCLDGYKITEEDKQAVKKSQMTNVLIVGVIMVVLIWWIGSGIWW